jgi:NADP-dependent 3-hydroxy acid dehydrogenase YdfG
MVLLKDIRLSNDAFKASERHVVALFVGGTSGIGKGTLIQLVKHVPAPTVYIVGRSKRSATPLLGELNSLNPDARFIFLETEVSLIKNVDAVCKEIRANETKLDLLYMSAGYLSLDGRKGTVSEPAGIDI